MTKGLREAAAAQRPSATTTHVFLLRHGQTEGNRLGQLLGVTDLSLNATGQEQARLLGKWLAGQERIDGVYSSAMARAVETAAIVCRELGRLEPHLVDADLGEMNFGQAEGVPVAEIGVHFPHLAEYVDRTLAEHPDWQWPGGDFRIAYYQRAVDTVNRLAAQHVGQTVALVTHGGVITGYLHWISRQILGFSVDFHVENCSITELDWQPDTVTVVRAGERPWLQAPSDNSD
ncbi:MAG: histidine phosphatase family protein [Chloroflexota bacterium]